MFYNVICRAFKQTMNDVFDLLNNSRLSNQVGKILIDEGQILLPLLQTFLQVHPILFRERPIAHRQDGNRLSEMINFASNAFSSDRLRHI